MNSDLHLPAFSILTFQQRVRVRNVLDAHVRGVVLDTLAGVERRDAEQHDFSERCGVLERRGRFRVTANRLDPIHFVTGIDARIALARFARALVQGAGQ